MCETVVDIILRINSPFCSAFVQYLEAQLFSSNLMMYLYVYVSRNISVPNSNNNNELRRIDMQKHSSYVSIEHHTVFSASVRYLEAKLSTFPLDDVYVSMLFDFLLCT